MNRWFQVLIVGGMLLVAPGFAQEQSKLPTPPAPPSKVTVNTPPAPAPTPFVKDPDHWRKPLSAPIKFREF